MPAVCWKQISMMHSSFIALDSQDRIRRSNSISIQRFNLLEYTYGMIKIYAMNEMDT